MKILEAPVEDDASPMETAATDELLALETGTLDPAKFRHADHVRLGYEMLGRYPFGEAVSRFSRGLRLIAEKAGRPEVYHETMTVAFLALIGERRARDRHASWDDFKDNNGDLLEKRCLERWYTAEQLQSDLARRAFCLPLRSGDDHSSGAQLYFLRRRRGRFYPHSQERAEEKDGGAPDLGGREPLTKK